MYDLAMIYLVRLLSRYFLTGRPLSGRPVDNATMFRAATKDYRDGPLERLSAPVWQRLVRRWVIIGVPLVLVQVTFWAVTIQSVYTASNRIPPPWTTRPWIWVLVLWWGAGIIAVLGWKVGLALWWRHHRGRISEFIYPAWQAACTVLGLHYTRPGARQHVILPDGFVPTDIEIEEPGGHRRLACWTGVAWVLDRLAMRRIERDRRRAEESEIEDRSEPSTDLVLSGHHWPVLRKADLSPPPRRVEDPPVRIYVPPGKCGNVKTQQSLLGAVGPVLGMPDPKAVWMLRGNRPYVELRPNRLPPTSVTFEQIRRHFEATDIDHPVAGLSAGNVAELIDYLTNSPHVMVSGGSGTGKSVLLKALHSQRMHWGAFLVILDYKRVSHRWAHNLPGCRYAWRIEDIHYWALECGALLEYRIENVLPENDDTEAELVQFPVVDILVEEINSLTPQLQSYWTSVRTSEDPAQSPAVGAIKRCVNMGREYRMHVHIGAQRGSANVFGANGGDIRESFQTRLLARWTIQTWKMLAGGLPYQRCPSGRRGVWARVQGDEDVVIVQTPFLTNEEARQWALGGTPTPPEDDVFSETGSTTIPGWSAPPPADLPARPERVTLGEAISRLPGEPMTKDAIRQAKKRNAHDFPTPIGLEGGAHIYDLDALVTWKISRDRALGLEGSEITTAEALHRPWVVYQFDVFYEGQQQIGYIGQTTRTLAEREEEHRGDKPWADLIIGTPRVLWSSDSCTRQELDDQEMYFIHKLCPRFNIDGQLGAGHQVPKWVQEQERQARQRLLGLPEWRPDREVYGRRQIGVS